MVLLCFGVCTGRSVGQTSTTPAASRQTGLAVTATVPAFDATSVPPDTPLHITFTSAPVVGSGRIEVFNATNDHLIDSIDVSVQTRTRTIGGLPDYNYYPVIISGNQASIYLVNKALAYNTTYYVKIDAEAFKDRGGNPFAGFTDAKAWRFKTKTAPPVAGARKLSVAADGSGDFATVQGALDFVPEGNKAPTTIFIHNGTYNEIIFLTGKDNLTILGEDRKQTIIAYPNNDRFNNNAGGNRSPRERQSQGPSWDCAARDDRLPPATVLAIVVMVYVFKKIFADRKIFR